MPVGRLLRYVTLRLSVLEEYCIMLRATIAVARAGETLATRAAPTRLRCSQHRLYCTRFQPPSRSILSQRIEQAAREGNVDKVRSILKEHDAHSTFQGSTSSNVRPRLLPWIMAYFGWNAAASAYDYRLLGNESAACLAETNGLGQVHATMHLRSFAFSAEMTSRHGADDADDDENDDENGAYLSRGEPPRKRVRCIPHVYLTDLVWGRSEWTLHCRKGNGHTTWFTAAAGEDKSKPPKDGGSFEWSSSSSWRSG